MTKTHITRFAYVNTTSQAGRPTEVTIPVAEVLRLSKWSNYYGNPSYVIHMRNGETYLLVDDFGGDNDLRSKPIAFVTRRKDLFR